MELIKKTIEYKYGAEELHLEMKEFISDVTKLIDDKNYNLNDKSNESLEEYRGILWNTYFNHMSRNIRKKLNKYLHGYYKKRNIHKANLLFHFIHTRVLADKVNNSFGGVIYETSYTTNGFNKITIKASLKEQAIQGKRKAWKELRDQAEIALQAYKEEKGDFYK